MLVDYILSLTYPKEMIMIVQIVSIISRPICPTFIHDDPTRIFITLILLLVLSAIAGKIMRYFNES